MKDLFGEEMSDARPSASKHLGPIQKIKHDLNYRPSDSKQIRCQTCKYLLCKEQNLKRYYKCRLIGNSSGPATDIRLSCVCKKWEEV